MIIIDKKPGSHRQDCYECNEKIKKDHYRLKVHKYSSYNNSYHNYHPLCFFKALVRKLREKEILNVGSWLDYVSTMGEE